MTVQHPDIIWQAVLGDLQLQVTRPSFETWLKDTVGLALSEQNFVVGTPNAFIAEMLDQRMYSLITSALERVLGLAVEVSFEIIGQGPEAKASTISSVRQGPAPATLEHNVSPAMNPKYTFGSFIVGSSNELACAASQAISNSFFRSYNPLFIYAGVGLGKTHLMHAIGHSILSTGKSVIYATAEDFTNQYVRAIRDRDTDGFRDHYRGAGVLLLDDIQFIIGKDQTQEGFFHTFNALHMSGRQIVISSDRPLSSLSLLQDRVCSRLGGGLVVDIQPPDIETRLAIISAKAEASNLQLPSDILHYLSTKIRSNIREIEGCINRLAAYSQLISGAITLTVVKGLVADLVSPSVAQRVSEVRVLDAVAVHFAISKDALMSRRRDRHTAQARQIAMYLLREDANLSFKAVGKFLGGKDHSTVLHGCQKVSSAMKDGGDTSMIINSIREALVVSP